MTTATMSLTAYAAALEIDREAAEATLSAEFAHGMIESSAKSPTSPYFIAAAYQWYLDQKEQEQAIEMVQDEEAKLDADADGEADANAEALTPLDKLQAQNFHDDRTAFRRWVRKTLRAMGIDKEDWKMEDGEYIAQVGDDDYLVIALNDDGRVSVVSE